MATPEFITQLRRHIGHSPLWLMGANLLILREGTHQPEVLLFRRSDNGEWGGIAGIVEPGEHPAETAVREALEEGCIHVAIDRLLWLDVMEPITYVNGDQCQFLDHGFSGHIIEGQPAIGDGEASEFGWFPVDQLPSPRQVRLSAQVAVCVANPDGVVFDLGAW